jgi:DNA (cytosine-5)-methyltransferase 1
MKVISLFSGAGGFDLGLIQAGHEVIWANDIIPEAVETYKANIGNHIVCGDITEIDFTKVPDAELMIGGFPCQGFSIANMNRKREDPRNILYLEYLRALKTKQPKYFIAENVRGILSLDKGLVFKNIIEKFEDCGYNIQYQLLNASDFGIPQNRYRVFIFGVRKDLKIIPNFEFTPSHGKNKLSKISIGEALKNIPEPEEKHELMNHVCSKFKLKKNGYINHRQVDPEKPSPTVTARGDNKGGAMINHHPGNHRRLSVRETATIQTFPISFEFKGPMTMCYLQVGNAVPPMLAKMIGKFLNDVNDSPNEMKVEVNQLELLY